MDVLKYWKERGSEYYNEFQNRSSYHLSLLKDQEKSFKLLKNHSFRTILEVGCGFGRYTKIISNLFDFEKYLAVDLSENQIENAKKYVQNTKIEFQCSSIQNLNLHEKFELVFASEVLMHINFNDINNVIEKLCSLSSKKIISIDWYNTEKMGKEAGGYCFMHDYKELFLKYGAKNVNIHPIVPSFSSKTKGMIIKAKGGKFSEPQAIIEAYF